MEYSIILYLKGCFSNIPKGIIYLFLQKYYLSLKVFCKYAFFFCKNAIFKIIFTKIRFTIFATILLTEINQNQLYT